MKSVYIVIAGLLLVGVALANEDATEPQPWIRLPNKNFQNNIALLFEQYRRVSDISPLHHIINYNNTIGQCLCCAMANLVTCERYDEKGEPEQCSPEELIVLDFSQRSMNHICSDYLYKLGLTTSPIAHDTLTCKSTFEGEACYTQAFVKRPKLNGKDKAIEL